MAGKNTPTPRAGARGDASAAAPAAGATDKPTKSIALGVELICSKFETGGAVVGKVINVTKLPEVMLRIEELKRDWPVDISRIDVEACTWEHDDGDYPAIGEEPEFDADHRPVLEDADQDAEPTVTAILVELEAKDPKVYGDLVELLRKLEAEGPDAAVEAIVQLQQGAASRASAAHAAELEEFRRTHGEELQALGEAHGKAIDALKDKHHAEMREVRHDHRAALDKIVEEHREQTAVLQRQLRDAKHQAAEAAHPAPGVASAAAPVKSAKATEAPPKPATLPGEGFQGYVLCRYKGPGLFVGEYLRENGAKAGNARPGTVGYFPKASVESKNLKALFEPVED